jgi:hypothetical protein
MQLTPAEEKKVLVLDIGEAEGKLYLQEQVEACKQRHLSFKIGRNYATRNKS